MATCEDGRRAGRRIELRRQGSAKARPSNAGDLCAREHDITQQVQDEPARESYRRALAAQASGALAQEIVPVIIKGRGGETRVELKRAA